MLMIDNMMTFLIIKTCTSRITVNLQSSMRGVTVFLQGQNVSSAIKHGCLTVKMRFIRGKWNWPREMQVSLNDREMIDDSSLSWWTNAVICLMSIHSRLICTPFDRNG